MILLYFLQEYEDIAARLGNDVSYRKAIRAKVWKSRITSTLFDTKNYAKEIEGVFSKIWHKHAKGLAPDHILSLSGSNSAHGSSSAVMDTPEKVSYAISNAYL